MRYSGESAVLGPQPRPEFVPAPVSPALQERLGARHKTLLYAPHTVDLILTDVGMPPEKLDKVSFEIGLVGVTTAFTDLQVDEAGAATYDLRVGLSRSSIARGRLGKAQRAIIHESQHVADLGRLDDSEVSEVWQRNHHRRVSGLIEGYGAGLCLGGALGVELALNNQSIYGDWRDPIAGGVAAVTTLFGAYSGIFTAYRSSEFERRAYTAARKRKHDYPPILKLVQDYN